MTTEQEWDALKEAANRATPGPWSLSGVRCKMNRQVWHSIDRYIEAEKRDENIALVGYNPRTGLGFSDAKFIALANPATILALEAEHSRLRAENERLRTALSRLLDWPNNFGGGERSDAVAFARAALAQEGE